MRTSLVEIEPEVQVNLVEIRTRIESGEDLRGIAIPGLRCISCGKEVCGNLEKTGAHLATCLWNWYMRCHHKRCQYQSSLAKYFDDRGHTCGCAEKQRRR